MSALDEQICLEVLPGRRSGSGNAARLEIYGADGKPPLLVIRGPRGGVQAKLTLADAMLAPLQRELEPPEQGEIWLCVSRSSAVALEPRQGTVEVSHRTLRGRRILRIAITPERRTVRISIDLDGELAGRLCEAIEAARRLRAGEAEMPGARSVAVELLGER